MSGGALALAAPGAAVMILSFGMSARAFAEAWRGTGSGNLEYGVMPAISTLIGLPMIDQATGWPGWPFWMYFFVPVVLAVVFCAALIGASRRGRTGNRPP